MKTVHRPVAPGTTTLLLSLEDAHVRLGGVGFTRFCEAVRAGRIRSVKFGGRRLIPADALPEFVERLGDESK